mmetsp:Transcript_136740/g.381105  ORF Transcript_136740/g.381105 Transcript_136740/m.381105 type:complete len:408 (+) Transcript_136740:76-1299(+)
MVMRMILHRRVLWLVLGPVHVAGLPFLAQVGTAGQPKNESSSCRPWTLEACTKYFEHGVKLTGSAEAVGFEVCCKSQAQRAVEQVEKQEQKFMHKLCKAVNSAASEEFCVGLERATVLIAVALLCLIAYTLWILLCRYNFYVACAIIGVLGAFVYVFAPPVVIQTPGMQTDMAEEPTTRPSLHALAATVVLLCLAVACGLGARIHEAADGWSHSQKVCVCWAWECLVLSAVLVVWRGAAWQDIAPEPGAEIAVQMKAAFQRGFNNIFTVDTAPTCERSCTFTGKFDSGWTSTCRDRVQWATEQEFARLLHESPADACISAYLEVITECPDECSHCSLASAGCHERPLQWVFVAIAAMTVMAAAMYTCMHATYCCGRPEPLDRRYAHIGGRGGPSILDELDRSDLYRR